MSITIYKEQFDNTYQEIFQKVLVAMEIANTRFQKLLSYGATVKRSKMYVDGVRVRDISIGVNRTIDSLNDTSEVLSVNKNKGTTFRMSSREATQAGPLNPSEYAGMKTAHRTAQFVDGDVFAEIKNSAYTFDNGDLTTGASTGTGITLSATTVPQMISQGRAKLSTNNQMLTNLALVVDSYGLSQIEQYLMSKNIDIAAAVFKNGYTDLRTGAADIFVSENLPSTVVFTITTNPSDGDTITIKGTTFRWKSALALAGDIVIGGSASASCANLVAALNAPDVTTATYQALADNAGAGQFILSNFIDFRLTASNSTTTVTLTGVGSGRVLVASTTAAFAITSNFVHYYYGKKGAIDVVIQDEVDAEIKDDPYQRAKIIMSDTLYGIKTFLDGTVQFLNVKIAVS
jgi:hypothetical protein